MSLNVSPPSTSTTYTVSMTDTFNAGEVIGFITGYIGAAKTGTYTLTGPDGTTTITSFGLANNPGYLVQTSGSQTLTATFTGSGDGKQLSISTFCATSYVSTISPTSGPTTGGTGIHITGTNLVNYDNNAPTVTLGGIGVTLNQSTSTGMLFSSPVHAAAGSVDLVITKSGASTTLANAFTYYAAPTITSVTPSTGPTSGGQTVVITGTNFTGATSMTLAGNPPTSFTVDSSTQIH